MTATAHNDGDKAREGPAESQGDNDLHSDPEATAVLRDTDDVAGQEDRLSVAEAKANESRNNHLRAVAELENVRKRAQRDIENAHRYGLEKFASELLGVKDSLEIGVEMANEAGANADPRALIAGLIAGKEATLKLLGKAFEKFNVGEINPRGERFDPQLHEAMAMQESATAEPDSVLQVVQKGYQLNGRLLRPARVIVAKAPSGKQG